MTTTTAHGLICLEDGDYAALALAMQGTALAIEAALDSISDSFDAFNARPAVVAATTTATTAASSGGEALQTLASGTLATAYSNMVPTPTFPGGVVRITVPATGWYAYGAYMNMQATGAVTAFSRRTVYATATRVVSGVSTQLSQVVWRTTDTGNNNEFLDVSGGSFYAAVGTTVDVQAFWSHANAASTVQVNPGARVWCHFIGSGVEIGSA